jgi:hypothetical protein
LGTSSSHGPGGGLTIARLGYFSSSSDGGLSDLFDLHKGDTAAPDSLRPFGDTNVGFDISIKGDYTDLKFYVARDIGTNNWLGCNGITSEKHAIAWLKWGP